MADAQSAIANLLDALGEDVFSMTDEEIVAEAREDGINIEALAQYWRNRWEAAVAAHAGRHPSASPPPPAAPAA
jgi:hypothetical protein